MLAIIRDKNVNTQFTVSITDAHLELRQSNEDGSFTKRSDFIIAGSASTLVLSGIMTEFDIHSTQRGWCTINLDFAAFSSIELIRALLRRWLGFPSLRWLSILTGAHFSWRLDTGPINRAPDGIQQIPNETVRGSFSKRTTV